MAEVMFKLLRCDAEASHVLGWAKKEVRRLVDHAKLDAFQRTWSLGDVTVRTSYFGGVARLWLEAAGTERMAVWATLPNPYPYRGAKFVQRTPGVPSMGGSSWEVSDEVFVNPETSVTTYITEYASLAIILDGEGQVVQSTYGTATFMQTSAGVYILDLSSFYLAGSTVLAHISFLFTGSGLPPESAPHLREIMSGTMSITSGPASYSDGLSGYNRTLDAAYGVTYTSEIISSDGVSLAAEQTSRYSGGVRYVSSPSNLDVPSSVWALRRYVYGGIPTYSYAHTMGFVAPADCIYPVSPSDVVAPDPSVLLVTPEEMSAATLAANNAERDARTRRDARFTANVDSLIASAVEGTLGTPTTWDFLLKRDAPISAHTKRKAPLSVAHSDTVISASNPWVVRRTVSAEYTYTYTDENNTVVEEVRSTELVGEKTTRLTQHATPDGDILGAGISVAEEYVNWYIPAGTLEWDALLDTLGFQPTQHNYHAFITANADYISTHNPADEQSFGMGLFWTGDVTREGAYHADSTFSPTPEHRFVLTGLKVWAAKDMIPPMPAHKNTLRGEVPAFFMGYHTDVPVTYDKSFIADENSRVWEPTMGVGWTVTVIPVAPVSSGDSLGMFGVTAEPIVEIEVLGALRFSYSSGTGAIVCTGFAPAPAGAVRVAIPSGESLPGNALLIYGGIKWDDVKEDAKAQRKALNDPNDPAHDPLMKAVLDALTPTE